MPTGRERLQSGDLTQEEKEALYYDQRMLENSQTDSRGISGAVYDTMEPVGNAAIAGVDAAQDGLNYLGDLFGPTKGMARTLYQHAEAGKQDINEAQRSAKGYQDPAYQRGEQAANWYQQGVQSGQFAPRYDRYGQAMPETPNYQLDSRTGMMPQAQEYQRGQFNIEDDPGYQFRKQEGQKAIEASAAARGGALSGGTLKDLMEYGSGLASQETAAAHGRYMGEEGMDRVNRRDYVGDQWGAYGEGQRQYESDRPWDWQQQRQPYQDQWQQYQQGYGQERDWRNQDANQAWRQGLAEQVPMQYGMQAGQNMGNMDMWGAGNRVPLHLAQGQYDAMNIGSVYSDVGAFTKMMGGITGMFDAPEIPKSSQVATPSYGVT